MKIYAKRNPHIDYIRPKVDFQQDKPRWSWEPGCCASGWNLAMSRVQTEWVLNINPDCMVRPNLISRIETLILQETESNVVLYVSDIGFNIWAANVRKFEELGGYDERFWPSGGEDEDILCRISEAGMRWRRIKGQAYHMDGGHLQRQDGYCNIKTFEEKWGWKPHSPEWGKIVGRARV